jgi:hypothetical protein
LSRGKYLSLEEARQNRTLDRFAKEHPSETDRERFMHLLDAMSKGVLEAKETSSQARAASSTETRTRQGT